MQKMSKMIIFILFFFCHFQGFEIRLWEVQENFHVSSRCSVFYIFPTEGYFRDEVMFHLQSLKIQKKMQRNTKVTISSHFWALQSNLGNMKKL